MAAKKSLKKSSKKKSPVKPPVALVNEVAAVFEKHGFSKSMTTTLSTAADGFQCQGGKTPKTIEFQLPNGKTVKKKICV